MGSGKVIAASQGFFGFFSQSESLSYSATPELLQLLTPDLW
jgi:hypothetical protein